MPRSPLAPAGATLSRYSLAFVDIVGAELPCALLFVAIDARRNNAVGRGTGTLEDGLADGLSVDGQGDAPTQSALLNGSAVVLQVR